MIVGVVSFGKAPGVTVFSAGLAAEQYRRTGRSLLVEWDRSGNDFGGRHLVSVSVGMISLAAAAGTPLDIADHVQIAPWGGGVLVGATTRRQAALTYSPEMIGVIQQTSGVIDYGRWTPESVAELAVCDVLIGLVSAAYAGAERAREEIRSVNHDRVQLFAVGSGYPVSEISDLVGRPVEAVVPWDPRAATQLLDGQWGRRQARSSLGQFLGSVVDALEPGDG